MEFFTAEDKAARAKFLGQDPVRRKFRRPLEVRNRLQNKRPTPQTFDEVLNSFVNTMRSEYRAGWKYSPPNGKIVFEEVSLRLLDVPVSERASAIEEMLTARGFTVVTEETKSYPGFILFRVTL